LATSSRPTRHRPPGRVLCNGPGWAKSVVPGRLGAISPTRRTATPSVPTRSARATAPRPPSPYQDDGYQACLSYTVPVTVWRADALSFDPAKPQRICSKQSGKCLDVWLGGQDNGTGVVTWSFVNGNNQKWRIQAVGDGYYTICASHSGKCLIVDGASTADGGQLSQWSDIGADQQHFAIEPVGAGLYSIVAKHDSKAVEVAGLSIVNGMRVQAGDVPRQDQPALDHHPAP